MDQQIPKNKGGRPRLSAEEKARRGTLRPHRERAFKVVGGTSSRRKRGSVSPLVRKRDFAEIASNYMRDVLSGQIVACRWVRLVCERQQRDLAKSRAEQAWPYDWKPTYGKDACAFIERLPHVEGKWTTATIELQPWQVFLVMVLFGWRRRDDVAIRRFSMMYLEVARKAAKSTLMAAIALFHMTRENEPGASVICGAKTGQQARVVFAIMQKMVQRSPWLREEGVTAMANSIITADGTARPINAKASSQDGLNPSCIVLDEAHAQDFELHDVLKSAQGARANPLMLAPTTAGYDLLSVGYALHGTVMKVLEQVFDADHLLGIIYTLDDGDDWRDPRVWVKANPMLGITPKVEYLKNYCQDAQQTPGIEGEFRVKACSQWMQSASAWLSMTAWDTCSDAKLKIEDFLGESCWLGADLAQVDDLAAVAHLFERKDVLYAFVQLYLPEDVLLERAKAVPAYTVWKKLGILTLTSGSMIDYALIEADIRAACARFKVEDIAFDQFGSVQIVGNLYNDGWPARIEPKNAKTFTPPSRELETRVKYGRLRHDGNECLKWMASNTVVTRRTDDTILPKKDGAESPNKIDGIDAILQAIGGWLQRKKPMAYQVLVLGGR